MNIFKKLFGNNNDVVIEPVQTKTQTESDWFKFPKHKPPHDVVLAACYTYDCGWCMDTVWYDDKQQCWMTTGTVEDSEAHLPYSHWRTLPNHPNDNQ